ncbi:tRNA dimethylallyltransferase [Auxenochlorella protothecoides]|uniref:tRNA dimethylallyltransferase n=1 Tax=Auxenochlorella protothecoides TaxID=3075 RepID=A0A087SIY8_AUXPR|nr:tRNA dimethylallyltransferase [Auxenochlorella protothecoides]KFM25692.1 tRNA dimethylallyltransferase [Auxenochlorella protothecoides]
MIAGPSRIASRAGYAALAARGLARMTSDQARPRPAVVIITGPTAVGKTDLSIRLAKALDGEIISADSVQVYRQLDVGSDKIPVEARQGVPHHLIDILDPQQDFSAGIFHDLAWAAVDDIVQAWEEAAEQGQTLSQEQAWVLGCRLVRDLGDAQAAERLAEEPNNTYRLARVVEVLLSAPGARLSDFAQAGQERRRAFAFHPFFLVRPRLDLYRRIDSRVDHMVSSGLIGEAAHLLACGAAPNTTCATRAIGYRQALLALERLRKEEIKDAELPGILLSLVVDIQSATRKLCHRQMTWFRNRPEFRWLDATQDTDLLLRQICDHVQGDPSAATGYGSDPKRLFFSDSQLWSPQALQIKCMGS